MPFFIKKTTNGTSELMRRNGAKSAQAATTMASKTAASSSSAEAESKGNLFYTMRETQVAMAEIKSLPPSRSVYEKRGNIFFRTDKASATKSKERELEQIKALGQNR